MFYDTCFNFLTFFWEEQWINNINVNESGVLMEEFLSTQSRLCYFFKPIWDIVLSFQIIKTILNLSSSADLNFTCYTSDIFSSFSLTWCLGRYSIWHLLNILCIFERQLNSVLETYELCFFVFFQGDKAGKYHTKGNILKMIKWEIIQFKLADHYLAVWKGKCEIQRHTHILTPRNLPPNMWDRHK